MSDPDVDYLYRDEFETWESEGAVEVLPAFSAVPSTPAKYVQDRLWQERDKVTDLFRRGATVYVCGDGTRMAPAVRETFLQIYCEVVGVSEAEANAWADKIEHEAGRYVSDAYA